MNIRKLPFSRGTLVIIIALVAVTAVAAAYVVRNSGQGEACSKPPGGFLIVASSRGFNDSVGRLNFTGGGGPAEPWPVISVARGASVSIVVCNTDSVAHGFQIDHYYSSGLVSIPPGNSITVSFNANQTGIFRIYCQIPCPIHIFMQYGRLVVS